MLSRYPVGIAATVCAAVVVAVRLVGLWRRIRAGQPSPEGTGHLLRRARQELVEVGGQRRLLARAVPGAAHVVIFWGFLVLLTTVIETYGALFSPRFALPGIGRSPILGALEDGAIVAVLGAVAVFAALRVLDSPRRRGRASRFFGSNTAHGYLTLAMIALVVVSLLVSRGAEAATGDLPYGGAAFVSHLLGHGLARLGAGVNGTIATVMVDLNVIALAAFSVLIVRSKHLHILLAPLNVALSNGGGLGGLQHTPLIDLDTMDEDARIGAGVLADLSRKQLLDLATCTECGRCQDRCPAWAAGKELSPKLLVMALRDEMLSSPVGGGRRLVPEVVSSEALWACTTCGACVAECPVDIEHVDTILELRRHEVLMEARFPPEAASFQRSIERTGDPYGAGAASRLEWAKDLPFEVVVIDKEIPAGVDHLLWTGCAGAFDEAGRRTSRALAILLHRAGVPFGVLGPRESCTGDPARRLGNELLFQEKAKQAIATLQEANARTIVTACPHCFNTMANEYPALGGHFEVIHHSELLARLLRDGRLVPGPIDASVTYHDSCYLGRHNGVYDAPRAVLDAIPGLARLEMADHGRRGMCCGAGGARMWMEEPAGTRVSALRATQAVTTGADIVSTACPFCSVMLAEGVSGLDQGPDAKGRGPAPEVVDLAVLVEQATANDRQRTGGRSDDHP